MFTAPMAWSSSGLGRRPLKAEIGGSNPLQATKLSQVRSFPGLFCFLYRLWGFEQMRSIRAEKIALVQQSETSSHQS